MYWSHGFCFEIRHVHYSRSTGGNPYVIIFEGRRLDAFLKLPRAIKAIKQFGKKFFKQEILERGMPHVAL